MVVRREMKAKGELTCRESIEEDLGDIHDCGVLLMGRPSIV